MTSESRLRAAAAMMAARLQVFRTLAKQAQETESRIELDPRELWESADEAALTAYETALNEINGARPLPMEIPA